MKKFKYFQYFVTLQSISFQTLQKMWPNSKKLYKTNSKYFDDMIGNSFIYLAFSSTIQKLFLGNCWYISPDKNHLGNCWYISRDEIISRCSNNFRFSFKELGLLGRACQVERSKRTVCVCLRPGGLDLIQHGLN